MAKDTEEMLILDYGFIEGILNKIDDSNLNSMFFLLLDCKISSSCYLSIIKQERSDKEEWLKPIFQKFPKVLIDLLGSLKRYDLLKNFRICGHNYQNHNSCLEKLWMSLYEACDNFEPERDLKYFQKIFKEELISDESSEFVIVKAYNDKLIRKTDLETLLNDLNKNHQVSRTWTLFTEYYAIKSPTENLPCGLAIIINHENFDNEAQNGPKLSKREDSPMDVDALKKLWKTFGFETQIYLDYKAEDISQLFKELSEKDLSYYDVFVTCYMSHGNEGIVYASDNQPIPINELIDYMANKCKTLMNKPKLFFIEACQGTGIQCDKPIPVLSLPHDRDSSSVEHPSITPLQTDVFVAISSIPGFSSFASKGKNSWFIEALIQKMEQYGDELSIFEVMAKVNYHVHKKYGCTYIQGQQIRNCRQTVVQYSTLTKMLKLKKLSNV